MIGAALGRTPLRQRTILAARLRRFGTVAEPLAVPRQPSLAGPWTCPPPPCFDLVRRHHSTTANPTNTATYSPLGAIEFGAPAVCSAGCGWPCQARRADSRQDAEEGDVTANVLGHRPISRNLGLAPGQLGRLCHSTMWTPFHPSPSPHQKPANGTHFSILESEIPCPLNRQFPARLSGGTDSTVLYPYEWHSRRLLHERGMQTQLACSSSCWDARSPKLLSR